MVLVIVTIMTNITLKKFVEDLKDLTISVMIAMIMNMILKRVFEIMKNLWYWFR